MRASVFLLLFLFSSTTFSQEVMPDMEGQKVCWLGVDFSIGKFIGAIGFVDPPKIKEHYMPTWNSLLITERRVNILEDGLKFESLTFNTDNVTANNEKIEMEGYIQEKPHDITKEDVKALVSSYNYDEIEEPLCVSMVVETFDKLAGIAEIWLVFNFKESGNWYIKKLEVPPRGAGFRNYWLGALKEAIIVTDNRHKKWMKGKE